MYPGKSSFRVAIPALWDKHLYRRDYMAELPVNLRSKIFSYLSYEDIVNSIFVCKYFYETIRSSPDSVPCLEHTDTNQLIKFQPFFYLNIVTNKSLWPIQNFEIKGEINYTLMKRIMKKYTIISLKLQNQSTNLLMTIDYDGPFNYLSHLKFEFEYAYLDLNQLQILAERCPNLKTLDVMAKIGVVPQPYHGNRLFNSLESLIITLPRISWSETVPGNFITSFLSRTPNLETLIIWGEIFIRGIRPKLDFLRSLTKLTSYGIQLPIQSFNITYDNLPRIAHYSHNLRELYLTAQRTYCPLPLTDPLINVEVLHFEGQGCLHLLEYYGIQYNLRWLCYSLKSKEDINGLTAICKRCPNLEVLVVPRLKVPVRWIVEVATIMCVRLQTIYFESFDESNDHNIELFAYTNNIKNIYIHQQLSEQDLQWLNDYGFNVYMNNTSFLMKHVYEKSHFRL